MKIRIVDDLNPEDTAMLQALYSRSAESVDNHLGKVKQTGSGKFMQSYYVGYNHKSIADCGSTTLFIEDVSLLAAKAIQDWPLYSGQETSTRFINMAERAIVCPNGTPEGTQILNRWMEFYRTNQDRVFDIVKKRYPIRDGEAWGTYERAAKARVFDIMRGFLPAGITTQLSWHTNLRQAGDHLNWMLHHPASEIQTIAVKLRELLAEKYPSSGFSTTVAGVSGVSNKDEEARKARWEWEASVAKEFTYSVDALHHTHDEVKMTATWLRPVPVELRYRHILSNRPRGCVLPHFLSDLASFTFDFLLDFGSFRDIQRHRNGVCRMPLLDANWGFNKWYLEQLGDPDNDNVGGLRDEAVELIHRQQDAIRRLDIDHVNRQYYFALGYNVPCTVMYALPALLYVLELRSSKTVHPSLRRVVHSMVEKFKKECPGIALHADMDPDDWDVRRGNQTITEKR